MQLADSSACMCAVHCRGGVSFGINMTGIWKRSVISPRPSEDRLAVVWEVSLLEEEVVHVTQRKMCHAKILGFEIPNSQ